MIGADPTQCSSILGKRERERGTSLGEDARTTTPAKRPATRILRSPSAESEDDKDSNVSTPSSGSASSAPEDVDEAGAFQSDSKAKPTIGMSFPRYAP
jgi:hypothetical protein